MAVSPTEIRKGRVILYQGVPHLVMEMLHRTQGRQAGFVQATLRNLQTGSSTTTKIRSTETVELCHTESRKLEFSYVDDVGYHFMDPASYEDIVLQGDMLEDEKPYLEETNNYDVLFVNEKPVKIQLPASVELKVVESPDAIRGDTAGNVQKPAKMSTGLNVQVPLFIKQGETIRVSTADGSYLGRA